MKTIELNEQEVEWLLTYFKNISDEEFSNTSNQIILNIINKLEKE